MNYSEEASINETSQNISHTHSENSTMPSAFNSRTPSTSFYFLLGTQTTVGVLTTFANSILLLALTSLKSKYLKKSTLCFLIVETLSHLLMGVILVIRPFIPLNLCGIIGFGIAFTAGMMVTGIFLLAVDSLLPVLRPYSHHKLMTPRLSLLLTLLACLFWLTMCSVSFSLRKPQHLDPGRDKLMPMQLLAAAECCSLNNSQQVPAMVFSSTMLGLLMMSISAGLQTATVCRLRHQFRQSMRPPISESTCPNNTTSSAASAGIIPMVHTSRRRSSSNLSPTNVDVQVTTLSVREAGVKEGISNAQTSQTQPLTGIETLNVGLPLLDSVSHLPMSVNCSSNSSNSSGACGNSVRSGVIKGKGGGYSARATEPANGNGIGSCSNNSGTSVASYTYRSRQFRLIRLLTVSLITTFSCMLPSTVLILARALCDLLGMPYLRIDAARPHVAALVLLDGIIYPCIVIMLSSELRRCLGRMLGCYQQSTVVATGSAGNQRLNRRNNSNHNTNRGNSVTNMNELASVRTVLNLGQESDSRPAADVTFSVHHK